MRPAANAGIRGGLDRYLRLDFIIGTSRCLSPTHAAIRRIRRLQELGAHDLPSTTVLAELVPAPLSPDAGWLMLEAIGGVVPDSRAVRLISHRSARSASSAALSAWRTVPGSAPTTSATLVATRAHLGGRRLDLFDDGQLVQARTMRSCGSARNFAATLAAWLRLVYGRPTSENTLPLLTQTW